MCRNGISLALAALAAACSDGTAGAAGPPSANRETIVAENAGDANEAGNGQGVANLPSSYGRSFATLDEYLEHLRLYAGPVDRPWYRKIGPDSYELVTTVTPRGERRTYTRAELMREFGFSR